MIVRCETCKIYFNDEFRLCFCPHDTFAANDGKNNFQHHSEAYLNEKPPHPVERVMVLPRMDFSGDKLNEVFIYPPGYDTPERS